MATLANPMSNRYARVCLACAVVLATVLLVSNLHRALPTLRTMAAEAYDRR